MFTIFLTLHLVLPNANSQTLTLPNQGPVRGVTLTHGPTGSPVHVFKGIPYAQAPTGSNRFKRSKNHKGWQVGFFPNSVFVYFSNKFLF